MRSAVVTLVLLQALYVVAAAPQRQLQAAELQATTHKA